MFMFMNDQVNNKLSSAELSNIIDEIIAGIKRLPPHAMMQPLTQYDLINLLEIIKSVADLSSTQT